MASYNELNALIDAYINRNGVQAITGQILNGVLKAMVEQLGRGYTIMGAAEPTTDPGTPDGPECYFASETGTYTDFDGLQVVPGELALLCYTPTDGWTKATIYEGFQQVEATIDGNVGTPSVGVSYADGVLSFDFRNLKGNTGDPAGFGTIAATVDGNIGTPGVSVQTSGPDTAKNITFAFRNLKGETGVTSVVATVDNTSGNPQCAVSLNGQQLTLAFTGLKGAQGDTGSSVDYPFTIVNNLTTNDATQALSAAMGVQLESEISQLRHEVTADVSQLEAKVTGLNKEMNGIQPATKTGDTSVSLYRLPEQTQQAKVVLSTNNILLMPYDKTINGSDTPDTTLDPVTYNGVTFKPNEDGSITLSGTCSATTIFYLRNYFLSASNNNRIPIQAGDFTLGLYATDSSIGGNVRLLTGATGSNFAYINHPYVKENYAGGTVAVWLTITTSFSSPNGVTVYPMISYGKTEQPFQIPLVRGMTVADTPAFPDVPVTVKQAADVPYTIQGGEGNISLYGSDVAKIVSLYSVGLTVDYIMTNGMSLPKIGQAFSSSVGLPIASSEMPTFVADDVISLVSSMSKKNKVFTFFANITTMGTLQFFHGDAVYNSGDVTIDGTSVVVRTYATSYTERLNVEHGLTIKDYISVELEVGNTNDLKITIRTNGGKYTRNNVYFSASNGTVSAKAVSGSYTNARASWCCASFRFPLWIFGDSYLDTQNAARWPKHIVDDGFVKFYMGGYPGAQSASVLEDFKDSVENGTPKYVLWALGMNDADNGEINASWLNCVEYVIGFCESMDIVPILATIPNCPAIDHSYKNAWVKSSGYRYVDFAAAVGASTYPSNWYDGMLSTDNVHPLEPGAIALASRVLADLPEITR